MDQPQRSWRASEFRRTSVYDRVAKEFLDDEQERQIELALLANPEIGDVIPGTGGARKMRVALPGRGKSGGARVVYVFVQVRETVHLLLAYRKARQENLTPEQTGLVRAMVAMLKRETR